MTIAPITDERLEQVGRILVDDLSELGDDQQQTLEGVHGQHVDGEGRMVGGPVRVDGAPPTALGGTVTPHLRRGPRLLRAGPASRPKRDLTKGPIGRCVDFDHASRIATPVRVEPRGESPAGAQDVVCLGPLSVETEHLETVGGVAHNSWSTTKVAEFGVALKHTR